MKFHAYSSDKNFTDELRTIIKIVKSEEYSNLLSRNLQGRKLVCILSFLQHLFVYISFVILMSHDHRNNSNSILNSISILLIGYLLGPGKASYRWVSIKWSF